MDPGSRSPFAALRAARGSLGRDDSGMICGFIASGRKPSRGVIAPGLCILRRPSDNKGAGKAGCRPHPWPASNKKAGGSYHRFGRTSGLPCAMALRLIARSPWGPGFLAPIISEIIFRRLDTSVGVSGPHDFAVRDTTVRLTTHRVHRILPPTSVTIAKRPSCGSRTAGIQAHPSEKRKQNLLKNSNSGIYVELAREFRFLAHAIFVSTPAMWRRVRHQTARRANQPLATDRRNSPFSPGLHRTTSEIGVAKGNSK
jgi:hypothetical protein